MREKGKEGGGEEEGASWEGIFNVRTAELACRMPYGGNGEAQPTDQQVASVRPESRRSGAGRGA